MVLVIDYSPFYETLKTRGETTYTLIMKYKFDRRILHQMKHNRSVTLYTIEKLCFILNCNIQDIVTINLDKRME